MRARALSIRQKKYRNACTDAWVLLLMITIISVSIVFAIMREMRCVFFVLMLCDDSSGNSSRTKSCERAN